MAQGEYIYQLALRGIENLPALSSMTPWEWLCAAAGHLSFALSAASYMTTSLVRLRVLSVIAVSLGIFFNATLPAGPLWISVFWLTLFLAANLYRLLTGHIEDRGAALSEADLKIVGQVLPAIHPNDWSALKGLATFATYSDREIVPSGDVCWVIEGCVRDAGTGDDVLVWGASDFLAAKDAQGAFKKGVLVSRQDGTSVLRVPAEALQKLAESNVRLHKAVLDGLLRASLRAAAAMRAPATREISAAANDSAADLIDGLPSTVVPSLA